jgi:hypothetical protein
MYWVGPLPSFVYELTASSDGRIFLVYLPAHSKPIPGAPYLSVGTYPLADAFAATQRTAGKKGFVQVKAGNGVAAVYLRTRPTNIYLAFPGVAYQVELFDRSPAVARALVVHHLVVPVP